MVRGGAAAASDDVHPPVPDETPYDIAHVFGRLVILSKLVWQTGIGVCRNMEWRLRRKLLYERFQLLCPQCTIEPYAQQRVVRHCNEKGPEGLPCKCTAAGISDGA